MAAWRNPITGRFTTKAKFDRAVKKLRTLLGKAGAKQAKAAERVAKAKPGSKSAKRAQKSVRKAAKVRGKLSARTAKAAEQRRRRVAFRVWEMGTSYTSKKRGHNAAVNIRITRRDKEPIVREEMEAAVRAYRMEGAFPPGYVVDGVDWETRRGTKQGSASDIGAFQAIFHATPLAEIRLGGVDE
jgi:Ni/Co efflux regulator RcnB